MTTENGLPSLSVLRGHIEGLRRRLEWLDCRCERRINEGYDESHNGYDRTEIAALTWALPVLEAEWDSAARFRREIELPAEGRRPEHHAAQAPSGTS